MKDSLDQLLEITDIEKNEMEQMPIGVRGHFKKLFRTFASEQRDRISSLHAQLNSKISDVDNKYKNLYSALINEFLFKQEQRIRTCDVWIKALVEQTADAIFNEENNKISKDEFVKNFRNIVQDRAESIAKELNEQASKAALVTSKEQPKNVAL